MANLEPRDHQVAVRELPPGEVRSRCLDSATARIAAHDPGRFRSGWSVDGAIVAGQEFRLGLAPYAVARIDVKLAD